MGNTSSSQLSLIYAPCVNFFVKSGVSAIFLIHLCHGVLAQLGYGFLGKLGGPL